MLRKLLTSICLLFFIGSSSVALGQAKIGYMNTQEVLSNMPGRTAVQQKLKNYSQQMRQKLQQHSKSFQDSVQAFQDNQSSMTQQQVQQKRKKLQQMQSSMQQYQQSLRQKMQQKQSKLLKPLYATIDKAIASVAKDMNLDFVLNESTQSGDKIVYYASKKKLNITQEVLSQIKKSSSK